MSSIGAYSPRVPTLLGARSTLDNLTRTNSAMFELQGQLASGLRVTKPSDDAIAAATISLLDRENEVGTQLTKNLNHAGAVMNTIDSQLGSLSDTVNRAIVLASSEVGINGNAETRAQTATELDSLIERLHAAMNTEYAGMSLFAGSKTGTQAVEAYGAGFRYQGDQDGLRTDLGPGIDFPITLSADQAVGQLSSRQEGTIDVNPRLTAETHLEDLRGPMSGKLPLGSVEVAVSSVPTPFSIDLSGAQTVGQVQTMIAAAFEANAPGVLAAFPGGVTLTNDRIALSIPGGQTVEFDNGAVGTTAVALGLDNFTYSNANTVSTNAGGSLDPKVTDRTAVTDMQAAIIAGDFTISNGISSGTITVTPATTVDELKRQVERLDLGVRLEIDDSGNTFNVVNEVAGQRISVEEAGSTTATTLGIRSMQGDTELAVFNDGRGVQIDESDYDFTVTLSDGSTFNVDLTPADIVDVTSVLAKINADAGAAGLGGSFSADLNPNGNGIRFRDSSGGGGSLNVVTANQSYAAEDLGLLTPQFQDGSNIIAEDRATIRVDSLFTTLIELRDAMLNNDTREMTRAGERLEDDNIRLTTARALVGGRTVQVEDAQVRQEDRMSLNTTIKSDLQDLDYFEASTRFSTFETQLQATMSVTARLAQLSLINFL